MKGFGRGVGPPGAAGGGLPAGSTDGQVLVWDVPTSLWVPGDAPFNGWYAWGNWQLAAGDFFLAPYHSESPTNTLANQGQIPVTRNGTLRRMFVSHGNPSGAANIVYTLTVDGVNSALTVTLSTGTALGSDIVNTVAITTANRLGLRAVNPGVLIGCRTQVQVEFAEFV